MTVFVVQRDRTKNFSDAENFGAPLLFLTGRSFYPDTVREDVVKARRMIEAGLDQFQEDRDFVLLNGDPVATVMVTAALIARGVRSAVFLKWDRENRAYYKVDVNLR